MCEYRTVSVPGRLSCHAQWNDDPRKLFFSESSVNMSVTTRSIKRVFLFSCIFETSRQRLHFT
jgi:hypothetical protein